MSICNIAIHALMMTIAVRISSIMAAGKTPHSMLLLTRRHDYESSGPCRPQPTGEISVN